MQGALQEVEELPEWHIQECGNDRASVDKRDHDVASAVQGMHTKSQHQASRRDRQEQEQRHQVIAKLLRSDCPTVFETPMQRQYYPNDHQDRRQVQEVEEHIAHPGDLGVKRPDVYTEHEYLVHLRGVRLTFKMDPAKDQRKRHHPGEYRTPGHAEVCQPAAPAPPANEVLRHEIADKSAGQRQQMAPDLLPLQE